MKVESILWWIIFIFDFLIYGLCCIIIIKRKNYTSISIRSPTLLLLTIVSNFFMNLIIIIYKIYQRNDISSFYYIFRFMMTLSMILRSERIIICSKMDKLNKEEEDLDKKQITEKRYLYQEKFYVRILLVSFILFLIVMIIIKFINKDFETFELFYSFNYICNFGKKNGNLFKSQLLLWIIWNFIEQFILITYIFRIMTRYIKEKIYFHFLLYGIYMGLYAVFLIIMKKIKIMEMKKQLI